MPLPYPPNQLFDIYGRPVPSTVQVMPEDSPVMNPVFQRIEERLQRMDNRIQIMEGGYYNDSHIIPNNNQPDSNTSAPMDSENETAVGISFLPVDNADGAWSYPFTHDQIMTGKRLYFQDTEGNFYSKYYNTAVIPPEWVEIIYTKKFRNAEIITVEPEVITQPNEPPTVDMTAKIEALENQMSKIMELVKIYQQAKGNNKKPATAKEIDK